MTLMLMRRLAVFLLLLAFLVLLTWGFHTLTHDSWYHDVYCWSRFDDLDPFCP